MWSRRLPSPGSHILLTLAKLLKSSCAGGRESALTTPLLFAVLATLLVNSFLLALSAALLDPTIASTELSVDRILFWMLAGKPSSTAKLLGTLDLRTTWKLTCMGWRLRHTVDLLCRAGLTVVRWIVILRHILEAARSTTSAVARSLWSCTPVIAAWGRVAFAYARVLLAVYRVAAAAYACFWRPLFPGGSLEISKIATLVSAACSLFVESYRLLLHSSWFALASTWLFTAILRTVAIWLAYRVAPVPSWLTSTTRSAPTQPNNLARSSSSFQVSAIKTSPGNPPGKPSRVAVKVAASPSSSGLFALQIFGPFASSR